MLKEMFDKPNFGLLAIRVIVGAIFMGFGIPKLMNGVSQWTMLGGAMSIFGVTAYPAVFGFVASLSEALGGLLIVLGFQFRVATIALFFTMFVASCFLYTQGHDFMAISRPVELMAVFLGLTFVGPGKYSVDKG